MKKTTRILTILIAIMLFAKIGNAADILGCPNGIMKGVIWPRLNMKIINASQKYDFSEQEMVDIEEGTGLHKMSRQIIGFRMGYGLLEHLDIGAVLKYESISKEKKKQNGNIEEISENGLTGMWLSGKYIFIDTVSKGIFDYLKLNVGTAYKFPLIDDDEKIASSLTKGEDEAKFGILQHGGIMGIDFAGHYLYHYRGEAKEINKENGKPAYGKSGVDLADRFNYMTKIEFPIIEQLEGGLGVSGWVNLSEEKTWQNNEWYKENFYMHNVAASLHFRPWGSDYEKRKIFVHLGIPYAAKNNMAPDYNLNLGIMYTFY